MPQTVYDEDQLANLAKRFWPKVEVGEPDECWNWQAAKYPYGYGQIRNIYGMRPALMYSHRLAYILHYNEHPGELLVCHACDNTSCCNPSHLFLGTNKDNSDDKIAKNRAGRSRPRISDETLLAMAADWRDGMTQDKVALKYGWSISQVHRRLAAFRRENPDFFA